MQSGLLFAPPSNLVANLVHLIVTFLLKRMKYFLHFQKIGASPHCVSPILRIEIENGLLFLAHVHRHTAWMVRLLFDKVNC